MRRTASSKESRIQALQDNRYLQGLPDEILSELADRTHLLSYDEEEIIFLEGQTCAGLYINHSGRVKVYKNSPSGREMVITVIEPGESFNEVPVFDLGDNPANAAAVLDSDLWLIDADGLRSVVANHPEAARQIIINLSQNLRMLVSKVAELSFYTVTARLARLLGELPPVQLSGTGPERITQDDLAARIGTVREVVARSLKELENFGAIELTRGKISILNRDMLDNWE